MAYVVTKLTDFSAAALEQASAELFSALDLEAKEVSGEAELKIFRDRWIARKNGVLTQLNDLWLKAAPKTAKRDVGQRVNEIKARVEDLLEKAEHLGLETATGTPEEAGFADITLPGARRRIGAEHPLSAQLTKSFPSSRSWVIPLPKGQSSRRITTTSRREFSAEPSGSGYAGYSVYCRAVEEGRARAIAFANAYLAGADPHHGEDAASDSHRDSGNGASQRPSGCQPFADVSSGRGARRRYGYYLRRSEGNARSRDEGAVWVVGEDAFPARRFFHSPSRARRCTFPASSAAAAASAEPSLPSVQADGMD